MDQVVTGVRRILSMPIIYDTFQLMVGGVAARRRVCEQYVVPLAPRTVADVGCGTAELLKYLPADISYFGFDLSSSYIEAAKVRHEGRPNSTFICADLNEIEPGTIPASDLAIVFGVLHHINDDSARRLLAGLHDRLAPGGRVLCIDPAYIDDQAWIARQLIVRDRGQNVRRPDEYMALVPDIYVTKSIDIRNDLMHVPYTLTVMSCSRR
ncbi:class I SAM-dependent methyltransferase [Pinirhizobacter soli]|uniref:class I SAM-dependent methyltransferase n=1 Tax=Pinirhizobacter soli TaxID=2786953 RepID=UPI00202AAD74|nr:class I SAM-dependent methyltransferase [Pinirhizobacter soli]